MSNHNHPHCEQEHRQPMSRRSVARYALNVLLGGGAAALALMLPTSKANAGYCNCTVNGCPCLGFQGGGEVCTNCGHEFTWHANC